MKRFKLQQGIQAKHGNARFRYPIVPKVDAENESVWEISTQRKGRSNFVCSVLLCNHILLSPAGQTTIALDGEAITTVAATKTANTRAKATERTLLAALTRLDGVVEGTLSEGWQTDGARVLSTCIQVGRGEETSYSSGTGAVAA
jgi:hypothetical protein